MSIDKKLSDEYCNQLLEEARAATDGVFSLWSKPGEGSGATVVTETGITYSAGHMSFPSGGGSHAELLALMMAYQNNPEDTVIMAAITSTKPGAGLQVPCGNCLQKFHDYRTEMIVRHREDMISRRNFEEPGDFRFICDIPGKGYEIKYLKELLPEPWKTNG